MAISLDEIKAIKVFSRAHSSTEVKAQKDFVKIYLKKEEKLLEERQKTNNVYFVLEGKVSIFKLTEGGQKKIIYLLGKGEMINDDIFGRDTSSVSCEAFEDSIILSINIKNLKALMEKDFIFTTEVLSSISTKMRRLYRQLKNTVATRIDRKVAIKLWKLAKEYGVEVEEGTLIDLNLTINFLAEMLGHPRENISKAMKHLEEQGLIVNKSKKIIVDCEKLIKFHKGM